MAEMQYSTDHQHRIRVTLGLCLPHLTQGLQRGLGGHFRGEWILFWTTAYQRTSVQAKKMHMK